MPIIKLSKSTLIHLGVGDIAIGVLNRDYPSMGLRQSAITFRETPRANIGTELPETGELGSINLVFDNPKSIDILLEQLNHAKKFMEENT